MLSKKFDNDASELQNKTMWMLKKLDFSQSYILIRLLHLKLQFFISHQWIEKSSVLLLGEEKNCGVKYDKN